MLLRDNKGALRTVTEVIPTVERREVFNGKKRYLLERCASASVKPNALVFMFNDDSNNPMVLSQTKMLIGNLKTEVAEGIIRDLIEKRVADISGFRFQKESPAFSMAKFDNGTSLPYIMDNFIHFTDEDIFACRSTSNCFGNPVSIGYGNDEEDDAEVDLSCYSDEELRRMIYESDDVTITELAAMDREMLEEKYLSLEV
ncbi:MAG: hypothetical protein J6D08_07285 [Lachnospiraceae bacterium]|nr:hypothetical protein [Lachnospiraceae bacterium]